MIANMYSNNESSDLEDMSMSRQQLSMAMPTGDEVDYTYKYYRERPRSNLCCKVCMIFGCLLGVLLGLALANRDKVEGFISDFMEEPKSPESKDPLDNHDDWHHFDDSTIEEKELEESVLGKAMVNILDSMLSSEPEGGAPKALVTWARLGPLTVGDFRLHTPSYAPV